MTLEITLIFFNILTLVFLASFYLKNKADFQLIKDLCSDIEKKNIQIKSLSDINESYLEEISEYHQAQIDLTNKNLNTIIQYQKQIDSLTKELNKTTSNYNEALAAQKLLISDHKREIKEAISLARKDAVEKSRSVIRGQASEHLAPYILKDTNPKDYRFVGNPIDYICFEGLSDVLDKVSDDITSVKFIDIKTGKSQLNKSQRRIRDAIQQGKVEFAVINLDEEMQNDKIIDQQKDNDH